MPRTLTHNGRTLTLVHRRYEDDQLVAAAIGDTPEVARQVYIDDPREAAAQRIAEAVG